MGCLQRMIRLHLRKVLRFVAYIELLYWSILIFITLLIFLINDINISSDDKINWEELTKIRGEIGQSSRNHEAEALYRRRIKSWHEKILDILIAAALLFLCQFILLAGVHKKNRCLIFVWILCMIVFGIFRIVVVQIGLNLEDKDHLPESHDFLKVLLLAWVVRLIYVYLGASYILQITNEIYTAEEVDPPAFRQQTYDPRLFREGLNYPKFGRNLEFASRIAALHKREHNHPKRWVPTYEAYDQDGRMVVIVDDPVYEHL